MSAPSRGTKRRCTACEAAFYDLDRRPIICPKCGAVHQPVARLKSDGRTPPRGRTAPAPVPVAAAAPAPEGEEAALAEAGIDDVAPEDEAADEEEDTIVPADDDEADPGVPLDGGAEDR